MERDVYSLESERTGFRVVSPRLYSGSACFFLSWIVPGIECGNLCVMLCVVCGRVWRMSVCARVGALPRAGFSG